MTTNEGGKKIYRKKPKESKYHKSNCDNLLCSHNKTRLNVDGCELQYYEGKNGVHDNYNEHKYLEVIIRLME